MKRRRGLQGEQAGPGAVEGALHDGFNIVFGGRGAG
jgi:hypothetical protein